MALFPLPGRRNRVRKAIGVLKHWLCGAQVGGVIGDEVAGGCAIGEWNCGWGWLWL